ncbi:MAG: hypothetical protein ABI767_02310 [Rhodanobacter sp.]
MKLQIEAQKLRVRIDEDELSTLLGGRVLHCVTHFANAFSIRVAIQAGASEAATFTGEAEAWRIVLPETELRQHAARLPSRDGLRYTLPGPVKVATLELLFDVDVRDSVRRRRDS